MAEDTQKVLKLWENYYPTIVSIILTLVFIFWCPDKVLKKVYTKDIINVIITLSGILFGFLLTVLALLMQSDSKSMNLIKAYGRFGELILFNKRAVYASALSLILSLVLLIVIDLENPTISWIISLKHIFEVFWFYIFIVTLVKTFRYIDIFYKLIKE